MKIGFLLAAMLTNTSPVVNEMRPVASPVFKTMNGTTTPPLVELYADRARISVPMDPSELEFQTNLQGLQVTGLSAAGIERLRHTHDCRAITLPGRIVYVIDPRLAAEKPRVIGSHLRTYPLGQLSAEEYLEKWPVHAACIH